MPKHSLEKYIIQVAHGDRNALGEIFRAVKTELMGTAFSITGDLDLAADVVQDTMLRVIKASAMYRSGSNARAWIVTICRNKSIDEIRRRSRSMYIDNIDTYAYGCESDALREERLSVASELAKLDRPDREIVVLHGLQNYTFREIAEQLDMNPGTVRSRFSRALAKLRIRLANTSSSVSEVVLALQPDRERGGSS